LKCIAVSRDGGLLASGDEFGGIRIHHLYKYNNKSLLDKRSPNDEHGQHPSLVAHDEPILQGEGKIRSLVFSRNGKMLFAGGHDNSVALIDTTMWKVVREMKHDGTVNSLAFDETYRYLAVGSRDKSLTIYDTSTYHAIKEIQTTGWVTVRGIELNF